MMSRMVSMKGPDLSLDDQGLPLGRATHASAAFTSIVRAAAADDD
jgi:hypothetical protein